MLKNRTLQKVLAIILIFTLTSTNFAFVTRSYASSVSDLAEALFGSKSDTGSKNVRFESYFETEDGNVTSVISDVNNKELAISMDLSVEGSGYLKDTTISILETEEENGLNFNLKEFETLPRYVQILDENVLYLDQIDSEEETVSFKLPIEYKNEKYFDESNLSKSFIVDLSGKYIDIKGNEKEIHKEVTLTVSWIDSEREVKVETETEKYIDFGEGVIVQSKILVNSYTENNTLPIKETLLKVTVPEFLNEKPSNVSVTANSTLGTNGETASTLNFNENNWEYNSDKGELNITVVNDKKTVVIDEFEDEYLQDINKEIIEDERYYNIPGEDEYIVTYTYDNVEIPEEYTSVDSTIEAKITVLSGKDPENGSVVENNQEYNNELNEKVGDIVSLNINNETEEISKAYFYSNLNEEKYEIDLTSEIIINITQKDVIESLKVEDVESTYVVTEKEKYFTDDIYYKEVAISKQNLIDILGENGVIEIYDDTNSLITVIDSNSVLNENGEVVVELSEIYSKLLFKTSAPIRDGNLVITAKKAIKTINVSKDIIKELKSLSSKMMLTAKYQNVLDEVEVASNEFEVELLNTETKASLSINKESLSTLAVNENVEMRIALNNASKLSDLYGRSEFEITLPESIESIKIHDLEDDNNVKIIHGDDLYISSAELVDNKTIRISIDGQQLGINSINIEKGTFISFNADIKVNPYTPSKTEIMKLRYFNSEATNYYNDGEDELEINYSAPSGFVTISAISNYNDNGREISSIIKELYKDDSYTDLLELYSSARIATVELVVMNNNTNNASDISILGRFPFEGNKDILSDEELGTTLTPAIVRGIQSDINNNVEFDIYYSENENANKNLNDDSNGWDKELNLENAKSYLIVPTDENYLMEGQSLLRFSYEFEIPENLSHNESIFSTFVAYYTNIFDGQIATSQSEPYLIGLTTGKGPEIKLEMTKNVEKVKELGEFIVTLVVENIGNDRVEDINVLFEKPENATYMTNSSDYDVKANNSALTIDIPELEKGEKAETKVHLQANKIEEDDEEKQSHYISLKASASAKDLGTTIYVSNEEILVEEAEFEVKETDKIGTRTIELYKENSEVKYSTTVTNIKSDTLTNVIATKVLPEELSFVSATSRMNGVETPAEYDESTRTVIFRIGDLEPDKMFFLETNVTVNKLRENLTECTVDSITTVSGDGTASYNSNTVSIFIGKPVLSIKQETDNENTYIKEGSSVRYTFTVENSGVAEVTNVKLTEMIPDGLNIKSINYKLGETSLSKNADSLDKATIQGLIINPKSELIVNVEAIAAGLNGALEKTVTNYATLEADGINEMESEKITHIVEASEKNQNEYTLEESKSITRASSSSTNITKTYKISGVAWNDENRDGSRDSNEPLMPGLSAKLVNSDNGKIMSSVTTDVNGEYTFAGVESGNYIIIFDYNTIKYRVTAYRKSGIASNTNSDAISTSIEQDGKTRNAAMTEVINISNGSVSNIDIGLVLAEVFDLRIDKTITKVTVQTSKGTNTQKHDNLKMVKTELAAKNIAGSVVYVEYEIKVTNVGDIPGYAKKIVDYIPNGMTFNSSLGTNSNWYTGQNNNLYTEELANVELQAGESRTVKLVLMRQMTLENTNIVYNQAEIYEDYNVYNISDQNSKPANRVQGEDDISSADIAILVKTGESFINISIIIMTILLMSIVIFIIYGKIQSIIRRKEGV